MVNDVTGELEPYQQFNLFCFFVKGLLLTYMLSKLFSHNNFCHLLYTY